MPKSSTFTFRLEPIERASLEADAKSAGVSLAAWVRLKLLGGPLPKPSSQYKKGQLVTGVHTIGLWNEYTARDSTGEQLASRGWLWHRRTAKGPMLAVVPCPAYIRFPEDCRYLAKALEALPLLETDPRYPDLPVHHQRRLSQKFVENCCLILDNPLALDPSAVAEELLRVDS